MNNQNDAIAVVIPAYNEETMIMKAFNSIDKILERENIPHKFVFVDDGSNDNTWLEITKLADDETNHVEGLKFSRNFGKEAAIYAGLSNCVDCGSCVVIDCDLQHPPEKIPEMYSLWLRGGYEIVEGVKTNRGKESATYKLGSKLFYKLISGAINIDLDNASDFKLLDRKAIITILNMTGKNDFFRALSSWIGYKTTSVAFEVQERSEGQSKWSRKSLVKYAINNLTSFSSAPMQIVTVLGVIMFIWSFVLGTISLIQKIAGVASEGFTTVIISQLFSSSIIMISLGIIGYYIAKVYEEVKGRPRFIVSDNCGGKSKEDLEHE